jgi:hypothetical protein
VIAEASDRMGDAWFTLGGTIFAVALAIWLLRGLLRGGRRKRNSSKSGIEE